MTSRRDDPPQRRRTEFDEDDRPRRRRKRRKKSSGIAPWVAVLVGGVSFAVFGTAGYFGARALLDPAEQPVPGGGETIQQAATAGTAKQPEGGGSPAGAGKGYVPRVSEKKLEEFLKGMTDEEVKSVTDEQVFAIMGRPTRRGAPVTRQKKGQVFTVYTAYWEVPGSGISSQISFANGRIAGMIVGLETTPRNAGGRE